MRTQKFGQTSGILIFAWLTVFGKDPSQDLGMRLSGIAGLVFTRYNEKLILEETADL